MGYTGTETTKAFQKGFTLLEVLIALLVLAIGLLGLAALQTTGLRSNTMATTRTHATQLAYDISDRMRANVAGSYDAGINIVNSPDNYELDKCPHTDTSNQANEDLNTWCTVVANILPGGDARITRAIKVGLDGKNFVTYVVTVFWDEARTGAKGKGCTSDLKVDLRCIRLNMTIPRPIPNA